MCPVSTAQRVSCVVRCSRSPPAGLVVAFGLQSVNIFTFVPPHKIIGIVNPPIQVKDKISSKSPGTFPRKFPGRYRGGGRKEEGRPTEEPKSARRGSREACRMQGFEGSMGTHQGGVQEEARTPTCARARWKFSSGQIQARCPFSILLIENVSPWDAVWCSGSATLASM